MNTIDRPPGLKLMTVFVAVLVLHVLVIGGFAVYHLMGMGDTPIQQVSEPNR